MQISAKKGTGIDELLETVLLVAEVAELRANPDKPARGTVIEAHLDRRIGPIATVLVATGTLHVGDIVSCGVAYGKVSRPHAIAKQSQTCAGQETFFETIAGPEGLLACCRAKCNLEPVHV